jgi:hypothetical protein
VLLKDAEAEDLREITPPIFDLRGDKFEGTFETEGT